MKTLHSTAAAGLFLIGATLAIPAAAHPADPRVNHRQFNQANRITQGIVSGQLTGRETARLATEQRAIRVEERSYKSDGRLTPLERADLNRDLSLASRDIRLQKHDGQRRF